MAGDLIDRLSSMLYPAHPVRAPAGNNLSWANPGPLDELAADLAQKKKRTFILFEHSMLLKESQDLGLRGCRIDFLLKELVEFFVRLQRGLAFTPIRAIECFGAIEHVLDIEASKAIR